MKHLIALSLFLTILGCSQSEPNKLVTEERVKDLKFPEAMLSYHHHDRGVTWDNYLTNLTLVGNQYQMDRGMKDIRIRCTRLASTQILAGQPQSIDKGISYDLDDADIYLIELKIPNKNWITKTVIYQGSDQTVIDEDEITIRIKNNS